MKRHTKIYTLLVAIVSMLLIFSNIAFAMDTEVIESQEDIVEVADVENIAVTEAEPTDTGLILPEDTQEAVVEIAEVAESEMGSTVYPSEINADDIVEAINEAAILPEAEVQEAVSFSQAVSTPQEMHGLPFLMTLELPQTITAGQFYATTLKIQNLNPMQLSSLSFTLFSEDQHFQITSFENQYEAETFFAMSDIPAQEYEAHLHRDLSFSSFAPYEEKTNIPVVLFASQDMILQPNDLKISVHFQFISGVDTYYGHDLFSASIIIPVSTEQPQPSEQPVSEEISSPSENEVPISAPDVTDLTIEPIPVTEDMMPVTEEPFSRNTEATIYDTDDEYVTFVLTEDENTEETVTDNRANTEENSVSIEENTEEHPEIIISESISDETTEESLSIETEEKQENRALTVVQDTEDENEMVIIDLLSDDGQQSVSELTITEEDPEIKFADGDMTEPTETYEEDFFYYDDFGYDDTWTTYSNFESAEPIATQTPYILIKQYRHKKSLYSGEPFDVEVEFLNTSQKVNMENVLIKVSTSDSISLLSGTNTLFVNNLNAGGSTKQVIHLTASSDCKEPTQKITFNISFEYNDNNERKKEETEESLTIQIKHRDRLEIQEVHYDDMQVMQEGVISVPYINKGQTSLLNMEASLDLDGVDVIQKNIYVGNIESGKNGTFDFLVTPLNEEAYSGNIVLTYEDSTQKKTSVTVPLEFTAVGAYVADDVSEEEFTEEEPEEEQSSFPILYVAIAGGVVLLTIIIIIVVKKKKHANKEEICLDDFFGIDKQEKQDEIQ